MINIQAFKIGWRYVFSRRKTHLVSFLSMLSMLGVVLAVALLIVVLSAMNGFDKEMRERILGLVPHVSLHFPSQIEDWSPLLEQVQAHADVVEATPFVQFQTMLIRGQQAETSVITGVLNIEASPLAEFAEPAALESLRVRNDVVVMGASLADKVGLKTGDQVNLMVPVRPSPGGRDYLFARFELAGTFHTGTELDQSLAVVNFEAVAEQLPELQSGYGIRIHLKDIFSAPRVAWELAQNMAGLSLCQ